MLYFIGVWSVLFALTWIIGTALLHGLQANCFKYTCDRVMTAVWLGTVLLADGLLLLSLGLPLSPVVGIALAVGVSGSLLSWTPVRAEIKHTLAAISWPRLLAFLGWAVLISIYMTQQVTWFDTGLYHFGAVRWLSEFGAVPGLALLQNNLGFTSSWFALTAPVNPEALAPRVSAVTNGFVLLIATWQGGIALGRWLTGHARITDKFMGVFSALVLPAMMLTTFLSAILVSSSPDIPVIFLTGIVAWSLLVVANSPQVSDRPTATLWDASLIPLILAVGTVSIKLSALPLLPITLLFYWGQQPLNPRRGVVGVMMATLLLLPLMVVSVVTSGCPFYPSSALCLDMPWRLPAEQASDAVEIIRGWDRWFGEMPPEANPVLWRFWQWLRLARLNLVMLLLLVISALSMGLTFRVARKQGVLATPWLFGLSFAGMLFILLRAPLIRFGLGYFVMIPSVAIALLGPHYMATLKWQPVQRLTNLVSARRVSQAALVGLGIVGAINLIQPEVQARLLLPPAMPTAEVEVRQSYDVEYVAPSTDRPQCWDTPIPCTPNEVSLRLRNPDRGLKAGFIPAPETPE